MREGDRNEGREGVREEGKKEGRKKGREILVKSSIVWTVALVRSSVLSGEGSGGGGRARRGALSEQTNRQYLRLQRE